VLEARAQFDGEEEPVFVRIAPEDNGGVCFYLGDDSWRAVQVSPLGWIVMDRPTVGFRRPSGLRPLPTPEREDDTHELRRFVNVSESDFLLLIARITAALLPSGPYPTLVLTGEQGSAKSTLARLLRLLMDPHASPLRFEPKEVRDLMVSARNMWVIALDDLSTMPTWLSDTLFRLATDPHHPDRAAVLAIVDRLEGKPTVSINVESVGTVKAYHVTADPDAR
jgi:hypothetical protein